MTFLELCVRLRDEAGISGTGPSTVVSQTGDYGRIVNWIQSAYEDIQNQKPYWRFLQTAFTFSTVDGTQSYTPTVAGLTTFQSWKIVEYGDIRVYTATTDEQYLEFIPWDIFRQTYLFGTARDAEGKPAFVTIDPGKALYFYPKPDAVYTIGGEYFKKADILSGNTDEPIFPSQYHMAIVYRALMFYGAYDAANERYSHGQNEYKKMLRKLEFDQGQKIAWGEPLA
jgi:hypothetical protein